MRVNARKEEYEHIELFGKPALFTSARIQTNSVPDGWYCYDLRGSDDEPGEPVTIEPYVVINHAGSVLTHAGRQNLQPGGCRTFRTELYRR